MFKTNRTVVRCMYFSVLVLIASVISVHASGEDLVIRTGSAKADLDAISFDVMKGGTTQDQHVVVTWFAPQYVDALGRASGVPAHEVEHYVRTLKPYNMFFVLSRTLSPINAQKTDTSDEILSRIRFVDRFGNVHVPLRSEDINKDAQDVARELAAGTNNSPLMRQLGTEVTVVMFRSSDDLGLPLADAVNNGSFEITMGKLSIAWKLPLDSVAKRSN